MACWADWGEYHDNVWGSPVTDTSTLFAQLSLCTQQCGVSWRIVWNKRHHYANAFHDWDLARVAAMSEDDLDRLCNKEGEWAGKLIQNRAKLHAIIHNATQMLKIHTATPGGLPAFLWSFVEGDCESPFTTILPGRKAPLFISPHAINTSAGSDTEVNSVTSNYSDALTAALKRTGSHPSKAIDFAPFKFLGSITIQAFLLQNGLLNGHSCTCVKNPRSCAPCAVIHTKRKAVAEPSTGSRAASRKRGGAAR